MTSSGGNLYAMAQRGARDVEPSARCAAREFALMTTPSISCARPVAPLLEAGDVRLHPCEVRHDARFGADGQAPGRKRLINARLCVEPRVGRDPAPFRGAERVRGDGQRAGGGDARVLLAQRARGGIARVGVRGLALGHQAGVERLERLHRQEHLAADLHELRARASESRGYGLDGPRVKGDVLARASVATRDGPHQAPVLVRQRQRQAVDLGLAQELKRGVVGVADRALPPRLDVLDGERVVERHHPLAVLHRREVRAERAADALRGRARRA